MIRQYICLIFAVLLVHEVFPDGLITQKVGDRYHTTGTVNGQNVDIWESPFLNGSKTYGTIGGQNVNMDSQPFLNGFKTSGTIGNQNVNTDSQPFLNGFKTHGTIGGQYLNTDSQPFLNGLKTHGTIGNQNVDTYSSPFATGIRTDGTWGNPYNRFSGPQPVASPSPSPLRTFGVQHNNAYRIPASNNYNTPRYSGWSREANGDYDPSPSYHNPGSSAWNYSSHRNYDYGGPSSRPVIPGYRYIGEENQIANTPFGDAVENAAIQAACYYGAQALVKAFSDRNEVNRPVGYEYDYQRFKKKSWGWVRWISLIFYFIALIVTAGFVSVRTGNKKLLNMWESVFDKEEYDRRCVAWRGSHTRRDSQGCLVSVEMPMALKNLLRGVYVVCALPVVIALFVVDWHNFRVAWDSYGWMALVGCSIIMTLPMALHRGKRLARGVLVFICAAVDICVALIGLVGTFAEPDNDSLFVMLIVLVVVISAFFYLMTILVSPETDEWLRMKKELKLENSRRRIMAIKAMGNRIITSRASVFVAKWYMLIAAVLIAICFVVIYWGVFEDPEPIVL